MATYVIDTNALLDHCHFLHAHIDSTGKEGPKLYTVPEVLRELKTGNADSVQVFTPEKSHVDRVIRFSKLTGDYTSLSIVDIKLIALTLQLESEAHGGDTSHLRTEPRPLKISEGRGEKTKPNMPHKPQMDEEWITPESLSSYRHKQPQLIPGASLGEPTSRKVSCVTADFAMQNVLLQMGLSLISPNGRMISHLKSFVLRCHACTHVVEPKNQAAVTQFCPSCGSPSLIKATVGIDQQTGERTIYLKHNFQYRLRGTIYSLPKPKGGRAHVYGQSHHQSHQDLILRPDQKEYLRACKSYERSLQKSMDDLHLAPLGDDGTISAYPTSGTCHLPIIGHGRRNPNVSKRYK
jgi:RNA-binding protein NOB1